MIRHRSLSVVCLVAGFAATSFGLVALSQGASAHTPTISASCSGVVLQATAYDGSKANQWSVTIDGATTSGTFGAALGPQTFPVPQDRVFDWSGRIAAFDGDFEQVRGGTIGPCVTPTEQPTTEAPTTEPPTTEPPTTEPPTTEPPTTEPPTTEPPTTEPPTTEAPTTEPPTTEPPTTEPPTTEPPTTEPPTTEPPTTEPPTTEPPCEEPTDSPSTGGPTDGPTTGEPCTEPPTTVEPTSDTETPSPTDGPTESPTDVLGASGTRGPDDGTGTTQTLPDTGAPVSASFQVDEGMVPMSVARGSLMGGLLLLLVGAVQLWRRESV